MHSEKTASVRHQIQRVRASAEDGASRPSDADALRRISEATRLLERAEQLYKQADELVKEAESLLPPNGEAKQS